MGLVWLERPRRVPEGGFSFDLKVRVHSGFEEEDPEDPLVRLLRQPALCEIASDAVPEVAYAPGEVSDGRLTPARALGRALRDPKRCLVEFEEFRRGALMLFIRPMASYFMDAAELEALLQQAKRPAVQQELQKLLKQFQAAAEKPPAPEPAEPKAAEPKAAEPKAELRPTGPWEEITTFALDLGGMNSDIVVDVRLKGVEALPQENVTCDFKPDSFDLKVLNLEGHNYRFLRTNLEKDIVPGESSIRVKKNHVLVTLRKVKEKYGYESWMDLCAKGKRRSAAKDTTDPQDGLMSMMKDLYEDGDDNMKKIIGEAMYKARSGQSDPKDMTNLDNMVISSRGELRHEGLVLCDVSLPPESSWLLLYSNRTALIREDPSPYVETELQMEPGSFQLAVRVKVGPYTTAWTPINSSSWGFTPDYVEDGPPTLVQEQAVDHTEHLFKPAQRAVAVPSLPSGREESGCCLAWSIAKECADTVQSEQLLQLHHQITLQASYFQAKVLAMDATNGVLSGGKADSMTRMGQLLSRWALSQQPPLLLHLGVDLGMLAPMNLPVSGTQAWHGPCAVGAKLLMSSSRRPGMVHMSSAVKEQLSALRFASMILGRSSSFYLDAFTEVLDEEATTPPLSSENGSEKMRFEDFSAMLGKQVDLSRFGKGAAKTVRQFYQEVVEEENSYLEVNGSLRRHVELVRISLRVRCPWGKQRELRIKCVVSPDGSRERNRPLAMALRDGDTWRRAVQRCFQNFGLEPDLQQLCFSIDQQAYSYEETVADSRTVPGIPTAYKTHKIVIMVKNPSKAELSCLGLPEGTDFTTQLGDEERHWTWAEVTQAKGEEELLRLLQLHGVDCSDPRSFCELHEEVYEKRLSRLQVVSNELVRQVRVVKVWLCAFILNCKHVLIVKTKQKEGGAADGHGLRTLSLRMDAGPDWEVALRDALWKRLGIPEQLQREELYCHLAAQTQEVEYSRSFPGLKTTYDIFEVHCEVLHPQDQRWQGIGLPGALDFTYLRKDQVAGQMEAVVTRWSWCEASRSITAAAASLKRLGASLGREEKQG
ncbi:unnamed protein product [Effrenium voratum]|nr:unnamed protein product [Effrenium voratum]